MKIRIEKIEIEVTPEIVRMIGGVVGEIKAFDYKVERNREEGRHNLFLGLLSQFATIANVWYQKPAAAPEPHAAPEPSEGDGSGEDGDGDGDAGADA
jgi:hypothetical protein